MTDIALPAPNHPAGEWEVWVSKHEALVSIEDVAPGHVLLNIAAEDPERQFYPTIFDRELPAGFAYHLGRGHLDRYHRT